MIHTSILVMALQYSVLSTGLNVQDTNRRGYVKITETNYEYEPNYGPSDPRENTRVPYSTIDEKNPRSFAGPTFRENILNVTVNVGREAVLSCHVQNLGQYKVGWLKARDQTILALHKRVITQNTRIQVSHEENQVWNLHIRNIEEGDRGCYMCQINTEHMRQEIGCIDVNVPPDIDMSKTSSDNAVQEHHNTSLICTANGHPKPSITWRREDKRPLFTDRPSTEYKGRELPLIRVGRKQMGSYLCIAGNDVPPAVSKRIMLSVNFAPEVYVPNQLIGVRLGNTVKLSCRIEAYPNTINYWLKEGKEQHQMLLENYKYSIDEEKSEYTVEMELVIRNITKSDLGVYFCNSTNSLGKADGSIRLYEYPVDDIVDNYRTTTQDTEIIIEMIENKDGKFLEIDVTSSRSSAKGSVDKFGRGDQQRREHRQDSTFPFASSAEHITFTLIVHTLLLNIALVVFL